MGKFLPFTFRILVFSVLTILFVSCASRRYAKLALKNEQSGLYEDAADLYLKSLHANADNIDAKLGAKKNGQITLDDLLRKFSNAYANGEAKNAVYVYLDAKSYHERFSASGISLDLPPSYEDQYKEMKLMHIDGKYKLGVQALGREEFDVSESIFKEILNLEPTYKDVKQLWRTAHYEPLYRKGKFYFENQLYRKSYSTFHAIITEIGDYKEAIQYQQDALTAAVYVVSVSEFVSSSDPILALKLRGVMLSLLTKSSNPFLKIVDRTNRQVTQNEQSSALSGVVSQNLNVQSGKSVAIKAQLTGSLFGVRISTGPLERKEQKGYLKLTKYLVENGVKKAYYEYEKINYFEYKKLNSVSCVFKFQLVSTETGLVLLSNEIPLTISDAMHYASYEGDFKNLVPGYWKSKTTDSPEDIRNTNYFEINQLQSLLKANRDIQPTSTLIEQLVREIATNSCQKIIAFNPEN